MTRIYNSTVLVILRQWRKNEQEMKRHNLQLTEINISISWLTHLLSNTLAIFIIQIYIISQIDKM